MESSDVPPMDINFPLQIKMEVGEELLFPDPPEMEHLSAEHGEFCNNTSVKEEPLEEEEAAQFVLENVEVEQEYLEPHSIQNESIWLPETLHIKCELPESEKIYFCEICKKFVSDMPEHYLSVHNIPWKKTTIIICGDANFNITDFTCPLCNKDFLDINQLQCHLHFHLKNGGLQCPYCHKEWFFYKIHLQDHIQNCSFNDKSETVCQKCNICNNCYTNISDHLIENHNASSIPYYYKNKTFNIVWNYCPLCQQNYSSVKGVRRHIKAIHFKEH